jgi:hypothetical protein
MDGDTSFVDRIDVDQDGYNKEKKLRKTNRP